MIVPYFKSIDLDTNKEVEGFYFEYPSTTFCVAEDYLDSKVKLIPCLVTYRTTDWGLPNQPVLISPIDRTKLERIGWVDTDRWAYMPNEWIKRCEDEPND